MKETMDTMKEKAVDAAQTAARAAKLVAVISQKKLLIAREQEKIRRNYTRLGKVYYKDYVTDEEQDEAEYKPLCEEISNSFRYINELKDDIADAKEAYAAAKQPAAQEEEEEYDIVPYTPAQEPEEAQQPEEPQEPEETAE